ncbi:abrin-a-like [Hibiscus syriacus]|uniref:abrin-a-like n=1 Tax=Hibiscus syriacus TaxID=106335 RepID=UPI001922FAEF|nr:abrin-a-like [Hibiscus syriacus]
MKVWVVLAVAVLWGCSISLAQPPTVTFNLRTATRLTYRLFITQLRTELFRYGSTDGEIALLPNRSRGDMAETSPRRYVLVQLLDGDQSVTIALDVTSVYVLGYRRGNGARSHLFPGVPEAVRNVVFPNTQGRALPFTERYGSLEGAAGVDSRSQIPLGIEELQHHIRNMNEYEPASPHDRTIARAILVCIQMISEPARFRFIEGEIAEVAQPLPDGSCPVLYPDALMRAFQNNWDSISENVQSAIYGVFPRDVRLVLAPGEEPVIFDTVASVRFIVALMQIVCQNRRANLQILQMPASISSSSLPVLQEDDETWNQTNQLWTLRSEDNTIRSNGKCLTTYGYSSGSYVMIYDCDTAAPDATKWEIRSDGAIRNPKSGLVLTASKDSTGTINLVVDYNTNASKQVFYATKYAISPMTTIFSYQGQCLVGRGSQVRLEKCAGKDADAEQQWAVSPDGTISPRSNRNECLKFANAGGASVNLATCDGWIGERWRFQNDGTILHVGTQKVLDVEDTEVTVNDHSQQRPSQTWFQGKS